MKTVKICYVSLIAFLLAGCGLFESEKNEFIPVKENKSDKWGFMSLDGEMIIENEFEKTPTFPMEGVFSVEEKDGYSVFLLKNRPELIKGCENLKSVGCMSNGVMPTVQKGKRISYINKKGEILFTLNPIKGKEIICVSAYFDDKNYAIIETEDNNFGYINNKGEVVINPNFSCALPFSKDGYALVCKEIDGKPNWQIIDNNGKTILKIGEKYNPCYPFVINEKLAVLLDDHFGFLDLSGKYSRCPDFVERIIDITKDGFVYYSKDKYGFMNYEGEQIIRARYSGIQILDNGKFLVNNDNEFLILNSKGEKEVSIDDYRGIYVTPNTNVLLAKIGNDWELINYEGKIVTKNPLSEVNIIQTIEFAPNDALKTLESVTSNYLSEVNTLQTITSATEDALNILESVALNYLKLYNFSRGRVYSDIKNNSDTSDDDTLDINEDIVTHSSDSVAIAMENKQLEDFMHKVMYKKTNEQTIYDHGSREFIRLAKKLCDETPMLEMEDEHSFLDALWANPVSMADENLSASIASIKILNCDGSEGNVLIKFRWKDKSINKIIDHWPSQMIAKMKKENGKWVFDDLEYLNGRTAKWYIKNPKFSNDRHRLYMPGEY
ncbi:MAG: WG repeat-containing protein [Muribaculaceae bacterium]|nr:WG repeat-containing protein [Muribaculaceae bacterium]